MGIDKNNLISILSSSILEYPRGSVIPGQLAEFFLEQYTSYSLRGKWLTTDMLAQWLTGEYDFPMEDVTRLIEERRDLIEREAGVILLMPGECFPPEALREHKTEAEHWEDEWEDDYEFAEKEEVEVEVEDYEETPEDKLELADYDESARPSMIITEEDEESDETRKDDYIKMAVSEDSVVEPSTPPPSPSPLGPEDWPIPADEPPRAASTPRAPRPAAPKPPPRRRGVRKKSRKKKVKRPASPAPPALELAEAKLILTALTSGGPQVDEVVAKIATEQVLTGDFEREICGADAPDADINRTAREALCWLLILKVDHAQYAGLKRLGGVILKHAMKQTEELLVSARVVLGTLDKAPLTALRTVERDNLNAINGVKERLESAIKRQKELVAAMSYLGGSPVCEPSSPLPRPSTKTPKKKTPERKPRKKRADKKSPVKVAVAVIVTLAILAVSFMYIKNLFSGPRQEIFDVADYSEFIQLKEARQSGFTFFGVVDSSYWNSHSQSEKERIANKLYQRVKSENIKTLTLVNEKRQPVVQTYSGRLRVF